MRLFAPIGAAAGLAAAFNAPISAILFVIEEVIGNGAPCLGSIVLSAISSVVVARCFWGAEPMFRIPAVNLEDSRELMAYAVLGVAGGLASLLFTRRWLASAGAAAAACVVAAGSACGWRDCWWAGSDTSG